MGEVKILSDHSQRSALKESVLVCGDGFNLRIVPFSQIRGVTFDKEFDLKKKEDCRIVISTSDNQKLIYHLSEANALEILEVFSGQKPKDLFSERLELCLYPES